MKWLLLAIVLCPFVVRASFWAVCTAKRLRDSGIELSWTDRVVALVLFAIGYPADFLYNQTVGVIRFGEFRDKLYSGRIQHYVDNGTFASNTARGRAVIYWTAYLNICDPTPHIHVP